MKQIRRMSADTLCYWILISDFLVGQAVSPVTAGARLRPGFSVGQLCELRADFFGALRGALLTTKRPVGNRPAGCNPAPLEGLP